MNLDAILGARAPWRDVNLSEPRDNSTVQRGKRGRHWFLTLSCGHIAVWSQRRLQSVPKKMRCKFCRHERRETP